LFDATMSAVYLSLNQGWTQYEQNFSLKDARVQIQTNAYKARTYLRSTSSFNFLPIDLHHNGTLATGYELANICSKRYDVTDLPNDAQIIDDLRNLIGVYRELKGLVGESILNIAASLSESDYQNASQIPPANQPPSRTPQAKKELQGRSPVLAYPRDAAVSAAALQAAGYLCENTPEHLTFTHRLGHHFMEAHHLIPLAFQSDFEYSLDVISNVICLCPNCHRAFHLAAGNLKDELIKKFIELRAHFLAQQGITITVEQLRGYYQQEEQLMESI
jgi:5-methylcytosine-specific restriction protein A